MNRRVVHDSTSVRCPSSLASRPRRASRSASGRRAPPQARPAARAQHHATQRPVAPRHVDDQPAAPAPADRPRPATAAAARRAAGADDRRRLDECLHDRRDEPEVAVDLERRVRREQGSAAGRRAPVERRQVATIAASSAPTASPSPSQARNAVFHASDQPVDPGTAGHRATRARPARGRSRRRRPAPSRKRPTRCDR